MKKTKSAKHASAAKSAGGSKDIEKYLAAVPEPARSALKTVRATIRSVAPPEAIEAMSYGIPAFKYKGSLFGYGAFPDHCSLFPMNPSVITAFQNELQNFETSKGTIRFPLNKTFPASLLKKLVKARIAQNEQRKKKKGAV